MRCSRSAPLLCAAVLAAGLPAVAACSPGRHGSKVAPSIPSAAAISQTTLSTTSRPRPGAIGISPGGVTTKVDVPADSSQDEYGLACRAAKAWMDGHGGDRHALIEPYLATLQAPGAKPGAGTFNSPWPQLTPAQQAAVIVAVEAAADNECG